MLDLLTPLNSASWYPAWQCVKAFFSTFQNIFFRGSCCQHTWKRFPGYPQSRKPWCCNPETKLYRLLAQRKGFGSKTGCAKTRLIYFAFHPLTTSHMTSHEDECLLSCWCLTPQVWQCKIKMITFNFDCYCYITKSKSKSSHHMKSWIVI